MATVLGKAQSNAARVEEQLSHELAQATSRIRLADLIAGGLVLVVLALTYTVAVVVADVLFDLPAAARVAGLAAFGLTFAAAGWRLLVRPLRARVNPRFAARQVERTVAGGKNAVINWVDLREKQLPASVRAAVGARAAQDVAAADVANVGESRRTVWLLGVAAALLAALAVLFLVVKSATFFSLLNRAYNPFTAGTIATRTSLAVEEPLGGDTTVTSGEPLVVRVSVGGAVPDAKSPDRVRLQVRYNPEAAEFEEIPLDPGESSRDFAAKLPPSVVQNGFRYRVAAGDATTPEFTVTVRTRPLLKSFTVRYEYPAYTRLRPEVTADPRIEAVRGTRVTLTAHANRAVKDARLLLDSQLTQLPGTPSPDGPESVSFAFDLQESGNYRVNWTAADGEAAESAAYPVRVTPDAAPQVVVTLPAKEETTLPADGLLEVDGITADDYGLSGVTLQLRVAGTPAVPLQPLRYLEGKSFRREADQSDPTTIETKQSVRLADLKTAAGQPASLRAGDVVEFWLEARDNCTVPTANVGRSKVRRVKIAPPSPPEQKPQQEQKAGERKQQEQQHAEKQAEQMANEQRPPQQPRPENAEPKPGEQQPNEQQQGQPNEGDPQPGEAGEAKPNEGQAKPNKSTGEPNSQPGGQPESGKPGDPKPGDPKASGQQPEGTPPDQGKSGDPTPKPAGGQPPEGKPSGKPDEGQSGTGDKSADGKQPPTGQQPPPGEGTSPADQELQKQAERVQNALNNEQPPEAKPGEAKPQPQPDATTPPDAGNKPAPQSTGEQKPAEAKPAGGANSQPSTGANRSEPKPQGTPNNAASQPGQEKPAKPAANAGQPQPQEGESGGQPRPQPGGGKSPDAKEIEQAVRDLKSDDPAKQQAARAKLDQTFGKENREAAEKKAEQLANDLKSGDPAKQEAARKEVEDLAKKAEEARKANGGQPGELNEKPQPGQDAKPGEPKPGAEPKPGDATKPETRPGEGKPMTPEPKPGETGHEQPAGEGQPTPDTPKPQPGGKSPDAKEIEQAVRDLKNGTSEQKAAAREKLDKAFGKENREAAERKADQLENDLKSGDPAKQAAARKEIEEMAKKAQDAGQQAGEAGQPKEQAGSKGGQPKDTDANGQQPKSKQGAEGSQPGGDKRPTPAQVEQFKEAAKNLNSPDKAKREAAEKTIDDAIGKEKREELQRNVEDLQSGDKDKQETARKKLEEMAKGDRGDGKSDAERGPGGMPARPGDKLDDNAANLRKTADLQLKTLEEAKKDRELLKKLGYSPEQYDEFLKGYREMLARQEAAQADEALPKPREAGGPATIKVGGSTGPQPLDKKPDAASGNGPAVGKAPPGYSEAQRRFAEEAAKLRKPQGTEGPK